MVTKRGELTSQQLITIIILIVSFVIILAFFFMLNLGGTIDKESCRNSVMMRGSFPIGKSLIDLKCKTKEVCFSMGGKCETKTKDFLEIKVRNEGEIDKEIVNLIADCWSMMGEGQVKYADNGECAICYKVYFDDKIKADEALKNGIRYINIYNYMARNLPGKEISYSYYLYKASSIQTIASRIKNIDINSESIYPSEEYAVVTRVDTEHSPPILVKFSANELKEKANCESYVTEA